MGRLDDGDFGIANFCWSKRHTHALLHSWKHTTANKKWYCSWLNRFLWWIDFPNFGALVRQKISTSNILFSRVTQLYIPVSTHILSCVGYTKFCLAVISASQSNHAMIFVHQAVANRWPKPKPKNFFLDWFWFWSTDEKTMLSVFGKS